MTRSESDVRNNVAESIVSNEWISLCWLNLKRAYVQREMCVYPPRIWRGGTRAKILSRTEEGEKMKEGMTKGCYAISVKLH